MSASSLNFLWGIHCFILCFKPRVWDDIVSEDEGPRPLLVHQGWDECHGLGVLALSCLKNSTHGLKNKSVFLLQTLLYSICGNICITDLFAATFSIVTFLGTGNVTVTSVAFSASACRLDNGHDYFIGIYEDFFDKIDLLQFFIVCHRIYAL